MKYYSEITKKLYNSETELKADEAKVAETKAQEAKKSEERAARAKEVSDAYKAILYARKHYTELKNAFIKDYGSFHMTYSTTENVKNPTDVNALIDALFNWM